VRISLRFISPAPDGPERDPPNLGDVAMLLAIESEKIADSEAEERLHQALEVRMLGSDGSLQRQQLLSKTTAEACRKARPPKVQAAVGPGHDLGLVGADVQGAEILVEAFQAARGDVLKAKIGASHVLAVKGQRRREPPISRNSCCSRQTGCSSVINSTTVPSGSR